MNDYGWQDLAVGLGATFEVLITAQMLDDFARLTGDYNPLHMDPAFAQAAGFPGPVVFGLLTASFYSRLVGMYLPGKWALLHGLTAEFKNPAQTGDYLTISGKISYLNEAYRQVEVKARVVNQNGKIISKATLRAGLHER
jgi:3-hydroxybutyryl-CoA dehydratase